MKQIEHDGITYNYELEQCNIIFDENGGASWRAVFRVKLDGITQWLHEISGTQPIQAVMELEELL